MPIISKSFLHGLVGVDKVNFFLVEVFLGYGGLKGRHEERSRTIFSDSVVERISTARGIA